MDDSPFLQIHTPHSAENRGLNMRVTYAFLNPTDVFELPPLFFGTLGAGGRTIQAHKKTPTQSRAGVSCLFSGG